MANRPCKPGADLKRMWRLLLPDEPFPDCGLPQSSGEGASRRPYRQPEADANRSEDLPAWPSRRAPTR